jgi:hypothetical protein
MIPLSSFCVCASFYLQKNMKTSPRWQHSDIKIKDTKANTDFLEDERDPDVIPAQYGNNFFSASN